MTRPTEWLWFEVGKSVGRQKDEWVSDLFLRRRKERREVPHPRLRYVGTHLLLP